MQTVKDGTLSKEHAVSYKAFVVGEEKSEGGDEVTLSGEIEKKMKEGMKSEEIKETEAINKDEQTVNVGGEKSEEKKENGKKDDKKGKEIRYLKYKPVSKTQEGKDDNSIGKKVEVDEDERKEKINPERKDEQCEGEVEPGERKKLSIQEETVAGEEKLKTDLMHKEKSIDGRGKPEEGKKLKDEEQQVEEGKIPTKGQKSTETKKSEREQSKSVDEEKQEEEKRKGVKKVENEEKDKSTKDFIMINESSLWNTVSLTPGIELEYSSNEEEEEEEEEGEEVEGIDRETAVEKYKSLQVEGRAIVKKNIILLKKLAVHFKKCKMEHVCKTSEPYSVHKEVQYHKQLLAFEEIRTTEKKEREAITKELEEMKKQRDELVEKLKVEFGSLIQREREIGTRLINIKTGKAISNSTVEQLLSRQTRKLKEVSEVRLDFIKLRDRVTAKEAQLQSLETVGENIRLIDYEKLQMENQSYADKIEDRDEKLQCLRNKATSAIQMIAHMKKKSHATDEKMDKLCKILEYTSTEVSNTHGYIRNLKKRRDFLRSENLHLHRKAGLLTQPHLLWDFAVSIEEATCLSAQVQNLKNSFCDQKQRLLNIQKSIDSHPLVGSFGRAMHISSGKRSQQRQSHSTHCTEQNLHATLSFHSEA